MKKQMNVSEWQSNATVLREVRRRTMEKNNEGRIPKSFERPFARKDDLHNVHTYYMVIIQSNQQR